ncbi:MAG TPA: tetratricopeptide repeat protein [Puia sp.]|nr:tetratricopeptide repeat protein [Puia sp.]
MKKKYVYAIFLSFFIFALGAILFKYKNNQLTTYALLERPGSSGDNREWILTKKYAANLQQSLDKNPADVKSSLALASIFIQEARVTGNYVYYDKAAMKYVNNVLQIDSNNFDALTFKALLYLSQHHFAEGLAIAEKAKQINPYNAYIYGLLVDGNVEMGNYDSAVTNSDHMVSIRPDLKSYSRISYLREIYGDYPGAIQAMKMAVDAGAPGDEATEWTRIQLGRLYENTGDLKSAEMHYTIALQERPGYAHALAGLARVALAAKDYLKAINWYAQACALVPDYGFKEEMVEAYLLAGQQDKAENLSVEVINGMCKDAKSGQNDASIGHYADRELANAYLKIHEYDKALEHAMLEYNRRPDNIDVNETVAWVYYCKGEYAKALPYIKIALKTNSRNPTLLCHAGLIYAKTGEKAMAKNELKAALESNPNIIGTLKAESDQTLKAL